MRAFPFFWLKREWFWCQINWLDGRRDDPEEDYGPNWHTVAELEAGKFDSTGQVFDARPVVGTDREKLWERYGPPS
ncbi:MAG TPA: hypothetical protein VF163_02810 [Micromonosporaceae bacterium]